MRVKNVGFMINWMKSNLCNEKIQNHGSTANRNCEKDKGVVPLTFGATYDIRLSRFFLTLLNTVQSKCAHICNKCLRPSSKVFASPIPIDAVKPII